MCGPYSATVTRENRSFFKEKYVACGRRTVFPDIFARTKSQLRILLGTQYSALCIQAWDSVAGLGPLEPHTT